MTPTETPYTQENSARILLVDDHPIVREGVSAVLSKHPDLVVCGEAAPLIEALKLIESETPDLAIIDLSLADGSGLDLIARIKDRNVPTKMLVLSMSDELLYAERVLRVGAMGYLHKQEARGKLVMAIRQILEGKIFVSETINNRLLRQVISGHQHQPQSPLTTLSNRELEVFDLLGQGLSSQEIADRLHLGIKTIEDPPPPDQSQARPQEPLGPRPLCHAEVSGAAASQNCSRSTLKLGASRRGQDCGEHSVWQPIRSGPRVTRLVPRPDEDGGLTVLRSRLS